jgi:PKD repeat protein
MYSSPGTYRVSLQLTTANDTVVEIKENYISISNPASSETIPYSFDFEVDSLIPKLSVVAGDINSASWEHLTSLGANGSSKCFILNSFNDFSELKGKKDAFELPFLNFTGIDNIDLRFHYSYARLSSAQRDSFKVQYSLDCGGNWININGLPTMAQLGAASGGTTSEQFFPTAAQWKQQIIPANRLAGLVNQSGVKIRFLFVRDINRTTTNNFFIDQIQLNGTVFTEVVPQTKGRISIFPNPSNGSFVVKINGGKKDKIEALLFDLQGRNLPGQILKSNTNEIVINSGNTLRKGVYTLMLNLDGQMFPQKLMVN